MSRKHFKRLILVLFFAGLGSASLAFSSPEFEISSKTRLNYILELNTNFSYLYGNQFYIDKSYLTLDGDLTENLKARVTMDFENSGEADYDFYFKYAYLRYDFIDPVRLTFGLQKVCFGYNQHKGDEMPLRYLTIRQDVINSADFGVMLSGELFDKMLEYHFQFLNGEGYRNWWSDFDSSYSFVGDLSFSFDGRLDFGTGRLGISYQRAEFEEMGFTNAFSFYASMEFGITGIAVDYIRTDLLSNENMISANLSVKPWENTDFALRYDTVLGLSQEAYLAACIEVADDVFIKPMIGSIFGTEYLAIVQTEFEFSAKFEEKDEEE